MNRPHDIWRNLVPRPNKTSSKSKPARRKRKHLLVMLKMLKEAHPEIYQGKPNTCLTKVESEAFCEQLRLNVAGYIYKQRRNFFILGLERGEEVLGWDVYIPAPITTVSREPPLFTRDTMTSLHKLRDIEHDFLKSLDNPIPKNSSIMLGYLVFSAAVYGGFLNSKWLIVWIRNPVKGLVYEKPIAWVDLYRDMIGKGQQETDQTKMIHRRWFLDPLTLLLVSKLRDQITFDSYKRSDPRVHLQSLMDHLNIPEGVRPKTLARFLALAHTKTALYSKTYLADYGAGVIKSASLPKEVWARVRTGKPLPIKASIPSSEPTYFPMDKKNKKAISVTGRMTYPFRKKLYEAIFPKESRQKNKRISSAQSKNNILKFLDIYGNDLSPVGWLLAEWAVNLLTYKRGIRKGSKIAASSVHSYITTITKPLHIHVSNDNITEYSETEFYEVYRDVIEQKSSESNKQVTAKRLAEFHDFLVKCWDAPSIDLSEFHRGSYKSDIGVNANLICPAMYKGIIAALGGLELHQKRESLMLVLITMLGQKCGLRRGEVLTLLCSDIRGKYNPVLFVRHNPYAYKKSDNAIRKISLKTFLTHKEIQLLKYWVKQRDFEDGIENFSLGQTDYYDDSYNIDNKRLLFCEPGEPTIPVDEAAAFKTIHKAMRQVTLDPNVHFHTLRHSFASWFLFRLESPSDDSSRPKSVLALRALENSKRRSVVERSRLLGDPGVSRKSLYQLAQTCGHASPEMSLRHYVHLLDLLLGCFCWKPTVQPKLTLNAVKHLTGIGQAMAYRYRQRSGEAKWLPSVFIPVAMMQLKHELNDASIRNLKAIDISSVSIEKKSVNWTTVQSILESRQTGRMKTDDIAQKYGIDSTLINNWLERIHVLYKMRTRSTKANPNGKPRHRLDSDRLPFPTRPQSPYDIDIINRIFNSFRRADKNKVKAICAGVLHFINYFSVSTATIRFTDKSAAKDYLNFISLVGIKNDEIRLTHYRGKKLGDGESRMQLGRWAHCLSVQEIQCKLAKSPFGQSKGDGTIGISIATVTGRTGEGKENKKPKFSMPYGFRYALYIIYIIADTCNDTD